MFTERQLQVGQKIFEETLSTCERKATGQIVRLDGRNSAIFMSNAGGVELHWGLGKISQKIPKEVKVYPVPVDDWSASKRKDGGKASVDSSLGALTTSGFKHDTTSNKGMLLTAATSAFPVDERGLYGVRLKDMCEKYEENAYNLVICNNHSVFFLKLKGDRSKDVLEHEHDKPLWTNSFVNLPDVAFAPTEGFIASLQEIHKADENARVGFTLHPTGFVDVHVKSDVLNLRFSRLVAVPTAYYGKRVKVSSDFTTGPLGKAQYGENTQEKENEEMSDAVSMADLAAIVKGEKKAPAPVDEVSIEKQRLEFAQQMEEVARNNNPLVEEGIKKPEQEETPPWEPDLPQQEEAEAPAEATEQAEAKKEESVKSTLELLTDLVTALDTHLEQGKEHLEQGKELKRLVKAALSQCKTESKTVKRCTGDAEKAAAYDSLLKEYNALQGQLKKLIK